MKDEGQFCFGDSMEPQKIIELGNLLSDYGGEHVFNVTKVSGMITALIIGPALFQPRVWLPFIFSPKGTVPHFKSKEHAEKTQELIRELYYDIGSTIGRDDAFSFRLGGKTKDAKTDLDPWLWCEAFLIGNMFCRDQYAEHTQREDGVLLHMFGPLYYFGDPAPDDVEQLTHGKGKKEDLDNGFLEMLPESVSCIRDYWREQKKMKDPH
jgi:yecA family protein